MIQLHYYPSNASIAPHMLLNELAVPFELALVDRGKDEHKSPAYLKLQPSGLIPVLVDGDTVVHQAAAICLHLTDQFPEARLAPPPGDPLRSAYYQWLFYLSNTLQAELITYFYPQRLADTEAMAARVKHHAEQRVGDMLDLLDTHLADKGPYMLGTDFTAADLFLFMLLRWTRMQARPATSRSHLKALIEAVAARPAVIKTFATEQLPLQWW